MMKYVNKICAVLITAAALSLCAAAADYGTPPDYEPPAAPYENVITAETVKDAIANGGSISIGEGTLLTVEALAEIAKGDTPVVFVGNGFTITIDPSDIGNNAQAVVFRGEIEVGVKSVGGRDIRGVYIYPANSGDFGFTLTLTVHSAFHKMAGYKISDVKAYYIDDDGNAREELDAVVRNGEVSIRISHASGYLLTDETLPLTGPAGGRAFDYSNPNTGGAAGGIALAVSSVAFAVLTAAASSKKKAK
ncbi:MAG: hypothetical protein LBI36_07145 [Oscillospiraceae bacterium]|nr:hypothetical protein [Oscillospiraceae bacterium]